MKGKKRHSKNVKPFGTGHWNQLVDAAMHPLFQEDKAIVWVDAALHAIVEQDIPLSMKKFIKYSLPELMKKPRKPRKKDNTT